MSKLNESGYDIFSQGCKQCTKCDLSKERINVVVGRGNLNPDILLIGEAPGKNEDETGLPFCGKAGVNLDKLLTDNNVNPESIYIANILKCRPPKNRNPTKEEMIQCTPHLIEQIKLLKPKIICTLGNFASKFILSNCDVKTMNKIEGISKLHGKKVEMNLMGNDVVVVPLYHPAAIIYNRKLIDTFFDDFKTVNSLLGK